MSWGMVAGAVIGGVASYAGQKSSNKAAAKAADKANKQAGWVDVTTTRKGDPAAEGYRNDGMQAAYNVLFGTDYRGGDGQQLRIQGAPGASAPRGGAPANMTPKQAKQYAAEQARIAAAKGKKKGGATTTAPGPAAPAARKFDGMSQETDDIRGDLMKLDERNAGMYGASEDYLTDTLAGEDRNAYRGRAASAADDIVEDERMNRYLDFLEGKAGNSTTQGGGGGGNVTYRAYNATAGPGGVVQAPQNTSATGADAALKKLLAGEAPAGWEEMQAGISRKVNEGRAEQIRQLKAASVGSGFYGGSVYEDAMEGAIARGDQELADSLASARFDAYSNALGLGTQYDLGMADIGARERASNASSSAAAGAAAADAASRERLAMAGMWGDALGMTQQGRAARAGALGDLAGMTSADQQAAVQGVNALGASRRGDLMAAGELSLGADSNRNAWTSAQRNERVGMAGVNLGRQELGFAREQMYDPLNRLGTYAGLLNTFYGGLGSETTQGRDMRSGAPASFQPGSVAGAAMSGAALGGQVGSAFRRQPSAGTTTGNPPGAMIGSNLG